MRVGLMRGSAESASAGLKSGTVMMSLRTPEDLSIDVGDHCDYVCFLIQLMTASPILCV